MRKPYTITIFLCSLGRNLGVTRVLEYPIQPHPNEFLRSAPLYSPNPTLTNTMACFVNIMGFWWIITVSRIYPWIGQYLFIDQSHLIIQDFGQIVRQLKRGSWKAIPDELNRGSLPRTWVLHLSPAFAIVDICFDFNEHISTLPSQLRIYFPYKNKKKSLSDSDEYWDWLITQRFWSLFLGILYR